jgi:hypothetical protein
MWSMIPVLTIIVAQGQPSPPQKWCFERDQGAQLCEESEAAWKALLDINGEIARSPCKPVEQTPKPEQQAPPAPKV